MKPIDYTNYTPATLAEQHFYRANESDATWKDWVVENSWGCLEKIPLINRIIAFVDSYFPTKSSLFTHISYAFNNRFDDIRFLDIRPLDISLKTAEDLATCARFAQQINLLEDENNEPVIWVRTTNSATAFFKSNKVFTMKKNTNREDSVDYEELTDIWPLTVAKFNEVFAREIEAIRESTLLKNRRAEKDELDRLATLVKNFGYYPN